MLRVCAYFTTCTWTRITIYFPDKSLLLLLLFILLLFLLLIFFFFALSQRPLVSAANIIVFIIIIVAADIPSGCYACINCNDASSHNVIVVSVQTTCTIFIGRKTRYVYYFGRVYYEICIVYTIPNAHNIKKKKKVETVLFTRVSSTYTIYSI